MLDEAVFIFAIVLFLVVAVNFAHRQFMIAANRGDYNYAWRCSLTINETVKVLSVNETATIIFPYPVMIRNGELHYKEITIPLNASGSACGVCIVIRNGEVGDC